MLIRAMAAVLGYIAVSYFSYIIIARRYRKVKNTYLYVESEQNQDKIIRTKMTTKMILVISLLFVLYNIFVTFISNRTGGDRGIYALDFYGYRTPASEGLTFIIKLVKVFTNNVHWLFYVSTFIPVALTLTAYRISREASPKSLLFLFATQYILFTLSVLKQAYANVFGVLFIVFLLRNNGKKDLIYSIACAFLAIWFHHTGYFLIPLFVMIKVKKNSVRNIFFITIMFVAIFFLQPILFRIASLARPYAPIVTVKIHQYLRGDVLGSIQTEGRSTFLKGTPFFMLTLLGFIKRKQLVNQIYNYDNYLFLSITLSLIYLATVYNGWIYRLAYYLYFPAGVFFSEIIKRTRLKSNRQILDIGILGITAMFTLRFLALMFINYGGF